MGRWSRVPEVRADRSASRTHLSSPALCTPHLPWYLQRAQSRSVTSDLPRGTWHPGKGAEQKEKALSDELIRHQGFW